MSSTFFTASPEWRWFIVAYFFLGGLAGGSYFLATLLTRFGSEQDRPLARLGYLVAFPIVCVCGLVLTVDLGRPERFWHMLVQSQTLPPHAEDLLADVERGVGDPALQRMRLRVLRRGAGRVGGRARLAGPAILRLGSPATAVGRLVTGLGAILGLYLAGYTGVLALGHQPADLGGYHAARAHLPDLGRVHLWPRS